MTFIKNWELALLLCVGKKYKYVARDLAGNLNAFSEKPFKLNDEWVPSVFGKLADDLSEELLVAYLERWHKLNPTKTWVDLIQKLPCLFLPQIKWEDETPTLIENLIQVRLHDPITQTKN